jgi:hypothetical protein
MAVKPFLGWDKGIGRVMFPSMPGVLAAIDTKRRIHNRRDQAEPE